MHPYFISLEGLDGSGKTTLAKRLTNRLQSLGHMVIECRDPGGTALGLKLRELILNDTDTPISDLAQALIFMASRAEMVEQVIRPALDAGFIVIVDRFIDSTVVYQGHAGSQDVTALRRQCRWATGGLMPGLTLLLDLPVELATQRRASAQDRFESRDIDYHEKVRAGFLQEVAHDPERIHVLHAGCTIDELDEAAWTIVQSHLKLRQG